MSGGPLELTDLDHRLRAAETIVREAGRVAADQFVRRELLSIDRKGAQDLVSEADASAKTSLWLFYSSCSPRMASSAKSAVRAIRRRPQSGWSTPIDGTHNFLTGIPVWCVSLGLVVGGELVLGIIDTRSRASSTQQGEPAARF
jgi:myo-inositol-1(or 4)-monophosphatase